MTLFVKMMLHGIIIYYIKSIIIERVNIMTVAPLITDDTGALKDSPKIIN